LKAVDFTGLFAASVVPGQAQGYLQERVNREEAGTVNSGFKVTFNAQTPSRMAW